MEFSFKDFFAEEKNEISTSMARTKQTKRDVQKKQRKVIRRVFAHPFQKNKDIGTRTLCGIKILKKIARGSFGRVYQGKRGDGVMCAVKFVDLRDGETQQTFLLESNMSELLAEEGIAPKIIAQWEMPDCDMAVIATELWTCTLEDYLQDVGLSKPNSLIVEKLRYCVRKMHKTGHVHLDIHEGNVLLKLENDEVVDLALTDFGKTTHIYGIRQEELDDAIDHFDLNPTNDPTNIDWQMVEKIKRGT